MVAQSPADRRRAQRRTARAVHQRRYQSQLPKATTGRARQAQVEYARSLFADTSKIQTPGDRKVAARFGSYAMHERVNPGSHPDADPEWEGIGQEYYYHD